jgi:hypothetical protein
MTKYEECRFIAEDIKFVSECGNDDEGATKNFCNGDVIGILVDPGKTKIMGFTKRKTNA